jgi:hypothetical protein
MWEDVNTRLAYLLTDLKKVDSLPEEHFWEIVESFDFRLPPAYVEVMKEFNGGEGRVGQESWLHLYPIDELKQINQAHHVLMADIPDYFLIGTDGGDTGYAFHKTNGTFHSFGLISDFTTDPIELLGDDFIQFLQYLYHYR